MQSSLYQTTAAALYSLSLHSDLPSLEYTLAFACSSFILNKQPCTREKIGERSKTRAQVFRLHDVSHNLRRVYHNILAEHNLLCMIILFIFSCGVSMVSQNKDYLLIKILCDEKLVLLHQIPDIHVENEDKGATLSRMFLITVLLSSLRVGDLASSLYSSIFSSILPWAPAPAPFFSGTLLLSSSLAWSVDTYCFSSQTLTAPHPVWARLIHLQRTAAIDFFTLVSTLVASQMSLYCSHVIKLRPSHARLLESDNIQRLGSRLLKCSKHQRKKASLETEIV